MSDLVMFLPGLGCMPDCFDLSRLDVEADLAVADFSDEARGLAGHAYRLDLHGYDRVVLVGHSMGGAVALADWDRLSGLAGFISVEGNLVAADCGLISRRIDQAQTFTESDRDALAAELEPAVWGEWMRRWSPAGLRAAALSLVSWSESGTLPGRFRSVPDRAYVHGDRSDVSHLDLAGTPVFPIPGAGHFPMLDNPDAFYDLVNRLVKEWMP